MTWAFGCLACFWAAGKGGNAVDLPRRAGRKAEPIDGGGSAASAAISLRGTGK